MVLSFILGFEPSFLLLVAVTLVLILVVTSWTRVPENSPPVPVRPYPLMGHLPYLGSDPRGKMMEWRRKFGDIYSIYMGLHHVVVLGSYDILKDTIVKQADYFSSKPHPGTLDALVVDAGILSTSGTAWKDNRTVSLFILRAFGMGRNVMADKIADEVVAFMAEVDKLGGKPVDLQEPTFRATSNVICSTLIGKRFEYDDTYYGKFLERFQHQLEHFSFHQLPVVFPWLKYLPGDLFQAKKTLHYDQEFLKFADDFIKKVQDEEIPTDNFISEYISEMQRKQSHGKPTELSMKHLRRLVTDLLFAGSETTSNTLLWFYLYMLHYPEVQRKIYEEIMREVGTNRRPTIADKANLPFLNATIMEVQRIASILPFGLTHRVEETVEVRNYILPKDTLVILHMDAVLLDDKIWGDANNFRPERFIDAKGELRMPEELIVFSLGRRVCLGEALARMELFMMLVSVLQRYEVSPADPSAPLPPIKDKMGITCSPLPYKLRLIPREDQ